MANDDPTYGPCPICKTNSTLTSDFSLQQRGRFRKVQCHRCGDYSIADSAEDQIDKAFDMDPRLAQRYAKRETPAIMGNWEDLYVEVAKRGIHQSRSIISHVIRKSRIKSVIFPEDLFNILKCNSLPTPAELADNLIRFLGDRQSGPGDYFLMTVVGNTCDIVKDEQLICGIIGTSVFNGHNDLEFIIASLVKDEIIESDDKKYKGQVALYLTFHGWQKYEELKRSIRGSRKAFMAMEFINAGKDDGNYYYFQKELFPYLQEEVIKTEFELANPLLSEPQAGNIHARLEVEIRKSRFVVAELSHHNNGAYWEAGFARGLDKAVIYMYNKEIGGADKPPHFDVRADQIVFWEVGKKEEAAQALKGVIRATLFGEAKMED